MQCAQEKRLRTDFVRLVAVIAMMMFLGFSFGAMVGEQNWHGPWPFAIGFAADGAWLAVKAFGSDDGEEPQRD